MKEKLIEKEELLAMLTEIYDQLEELEQVLETNISGLRQNWHEGQSNKITHCENKLTAIEKSVRSFSESNEANESRSENMKPAKTMRLKLGY